MLFSSTAFAQRVRQVETIGWEQVFAEGELDKHGRRIGRWDYWYARDLKKPYATGVYVRGRRHGPWSWYYMHGLVLRKGQYIHGRKVGQWRWWYPNGRPQLTSRFDKKGRPHGKWRMWSYKGVMLGQGQYRRGYKHGVWLFFNEDGSFKHKLTYKRG